MEEMIPRVMTILVTTQVAIPVAAVLVTPVILEVLEVLEVPEVPEVPEGTVVEVVTQVVEMVVRLETDLEISQPGFGGIVVIL